ncbi:RXLT1 xylosyltransferase, partial [Circaetus pectoralis]|nr:RXLT1 xylosyltransferase [Circaetus pectoralis]
GFLDRAALGNGEWNPWEGDEKNELLASQQRYEANLKMIQNARSHLEQTSLRVQIWGKAAIGLYLWQHIFGGRLEPADVTAQWREGSQKAGKTCFSWATTAVYGNPPKVFKSYIPFCHPLSQSKVSVIFQSTLCPHIDIIHHLISSILHSHVSVLLGLVVTGRKSPVIIITYLLHFKGTYGSLKKLISYRNFPVVEPSWSMLRDPRLYLCNFLGTVYKNSSRETLMEVLKQDGLDKLCWIAAREQWQPQETDESFKNYQDALLQSDLTLCPVGINTECYRIYEACSYGSLPVIEDVMTSGDCGNSSVYHSAPLQLLKTMGAPFIFIKNWKELPAVLEKEKKMSLQEKIQRRKKLIEWYRNFKAWMRQKFINTLENSFLPNAKG